MKPAHTTAIIHVSNLKDAVNYYTKVLGFKVDFEFGDYVGLLYGELAVNLSGAAAGGIKKIAGNAHFSIYCDEVDTYYNLISAKGANIAVAIADRNYGLRDFAVDDADGNTLVFGADIK